MFHPCFLQVPTNEYIDYNRGISVIMCCINTFNKMALRTMYSEGVISSDEQRRDSLLDSRRWFSWGEAISPLESKFKFMLSRKRLPKLFSMDFLAVEHETSSSFSLLLQINTINYKNPHSNSHSNSCDGIYKMCTFFLRAMRSLAVRFATKGSIHCYPTQYENWWNLFQNNGISYINFSTMEL